MGLHLTRHSQEKKSTVQPSHFGSSSSSVINKLLIIAEKHYQDIEEKALLSDDKQETFTSAGVHYAVGARLTALMALRAAEAIKGHSE